MITDRVKRLLQNLKPSKSRVILNEDEQRAFAETLYRVYFNNNHLPEVLRRAEFLQEFAANFVSIEEPWQDAIIERTKLGM